MSQSLTVPEELWTLKKFARGKKKLVEVGVCWGGTSKVLREVMDPSGTLFLVDPFIKLPMTWNGAKITDDEEIARANVESIKNGNVEWCKGMSEDMAKMFTGGADFVFIDGNHEFSFVDKDWKSWAPHVDKGGVVLFHDVSDAHPGVMKVWEVARRSSGWHEIGKVVSLGILERR